MNDKTDTVTYPAVTGPFDTEDEAWASQPPNDAWSSMKVWQDDADKWWMRHYGPTLTTTTLPPVED